MRQTRAAYVWTRVLDTPFWGLFNLLPFILYKDLHASPFEIGLLVTIKPVVSIFSSYWSSTFHNKPERLVGSIIWARWIAYLPFFLYPFIHNIWFILASFGLFMSLQVGMMPAWMELLKKHLPLQNREKIFSYTQAFGYLGGGLLPFLFGWVLDEWLGAWRWMFPLAAALALGATFWQRKIHLETRDTPQAQLPDEFLLHPWKNAWNVLTQHPLFLKFQIGFTLLGSGLMVMQTTLPIFFVDELHLSYTELGIAMALCKGLGFACSSPLWARLMQQLDIFRFMAWVALLATAFPLLLLLAKWQMAWLFGAFFLYGFMQAGSELGWNLSGPRFAERHDSTPFSSVNILAVGVRGLFIPSLGALLLSHYGSLFTIILSSCLCLFSALRMRTYALHIQPSKGVVN